MKRQFQRDVLMFELLLHVEVITKAQLIIIPKIASFFICFLQKILFQPTFLYLVPIRLYAEY